MGTDAVLGGHVDRAFLAFEVLGQRRASGSVALLPGGRTGEELLSEGLVLRRRCGLGGTHPGLKLPKGKLGVAEGFRPGPVLFNQEEPAFFLEQEVAFFEQSVVLKPGSQLLEDLFLGEVLRRLRWVLVNTKR